MPDRRTHRGPHPQDAGLFAPSAWAALRGAVADLSWLLTRGYAETSALKLVGDRFALRERQRIAVMRCACSDEARARRREREVGPEAVAGRPLLIDGYNVLTTIEAALGDGVLLMGRDGCLRDMASMHGSYRKVAETIPAITLLGEVLAGLKPSTVTWYLDSPVSNSGRLKTMIGEHAGRQGWAWSVELVHDPDAVLAAADALIATSDSGILDRCGRWFNLVRHVRTSRLPEAGVVDLSRAEP